jgi:hypothetical protein
MPASVGNSPEGPEFNLTQSEFPFIHLHGILAQIVVGNDVFENGRTAGSLLVLHFANGTFDHLQNCLV